MKTYRGVEVYIQAFLSWAPDGGERPASQFSRFTPCTHWSEDWVSSRVDLEAVKKKKFISLPAAVQPIARRYTDWAVPTPYFGITDRDLKT
jgi:hypothetical protein